MHRPTLYINPPHPSSYPPPPSCFKKPCTQHYSLLLQFNHLLFLPTLADKAMKDLIRKLSAKLRRNHTILRSDSTLQDRLLQKNDVPEGHVPVYVGEEMKLFVINAELLNHPVFVNLLNRAAQEYGYQHEGVLRIPCKVTVFERVLEVLRRNGDSSVLHDILSSDELF